MDNFPSPEFTANAVKHAQKQAAQTEFHTQIVSASSLASRAKSLLPLYQLKDRLDYKQALIEISLEDRTRFLEIVGENPTKKQQATAIQFFLEEERFEGYKEGADPSGPPSMVIIGYQRFIDNAVEATFFSPRRAEIPKLLHGFKHYYQSDRELGIKLGNPQAGIFCKSLAECLDNDSDLASFILAVAPSFPEDLPEMAEVNANSNLAKPTPARNGYISKVNLTFESIQNRIDFKEALIQLILDGGVTQRYFEAIKTRKDQIKVINKLLPQIGTIDEWEGGFLAKALPIDRDVTDDYVRLCEIGWKNHIDALKCRFEVIRKDYKSAREEQKEFAGMNIRQPFLSTPFFELFPDAELAKYVFLFEPDFPQDMPELTLPNPADYLWQFKPINQLNNRERWLALCAACRPHEIFPMDEDGQIRILNREMDRIFTSEPLPLADDPDVREAMKEGLKNAVNNLRDALHSAFQRDSVESVLGFIMAEGFWQCYSLDVENALWRSLVTNPLESLPLPAKRRTYIESRLSSTQPVQPGTEVNVSTVDIKSNPLGQGNTEQSNPAEQKRIGTEAQVEVLIGELSVDHLKRELIVNSKRGPAGLSYALIMALWSAPRKCLSTDALGEAVFPEDWSFLEDEKAKKQKLQELKARVKNFLNKHSSNNLGDRLLPKSEKGSNLHHINSNFESDL